MSAIRSLLRRLVRAVLPRTPARLRRWAESTRDVAESHARRGRYHSGEAKRFQARADILDAEADARERGDPRWPQGP